VTDPRTDLLAQVAVLDAEKLQQVMQILQAINGTPAPAAATPTAAEKWSGDYHAMPKTYQGEQTLYGFYVDVYTPRKMLGKSESSDRLYKITLRRVSQWLGRPAVLSDFTDDRMSAYLQHCYDIGLAGASVSKEANNVLALWRYAAKRRLVAREPDIETPSYAAPVPDSFSPEEVQAIYDAAGKLQGLSYNVPRSLLFQGLVLTIYDSGERVGALLKCKWEDLSDGWLTVHGSYRKSKKAGKRFKLRPETVAVTDRIRVVSTSDKIFGWQGNYTYIWRVFGKVLTEAGLPDHRRGKFHKIRRTVASQYEAAGGNATQLLGHSNRRVTEAYLDTRIVKTPQPADLIQSLKLSHDRTSPSPK
jgi:integrase